MTIDPNELAPGIRALVLDLRAHGFQTCDSGDGTGKMDGALPYRHVFSTCPVDLMVSEAERMARIYPESRVELLWSPNEPAMIALYPDQNADGTEKDCGFGPLRKKPSAWAETPDFLVEKGSLFRGLAIEGRSDPDPYQQKSLTVNNDCRAGRDGDCTWTECPQERDNEPRKTGRHCPLDVSE